MKNFGFSNLVLVNPNLTEESYEYAVHARDVLTNATLLEDFGEALRLFDLTVGTTGKPGKRFSTHRSPIYPWELRELLEGYNGRVALFFGRESIGLKNEELERLDVTLTIPTSEAYPVMNLAQAVAVVLYELSKRRPEPQVEALKPATEVEKEVLVETWRELLRTLDYPRDPERREVFVKVFNRAVRKSFLYGREIHTIIGPLRKAVKRLEECR